MAGSMYGPGSKTGDDDADAGVLGRSRERRRRAVRPADRLDRGHHPGTGAAVANRELPVDACLVVVGRPWTVVDRVDDGVDGRVQVGVTGPNPCSSR